MLCTKSQDTTGLSRVESQFLARRAALILGDTTDFSRVEFQLRPTQTQENGRN